MKSWVHKAKRSGSLKPTSNGTQNIWGGPGASSDRNVSFSPQLEDLSNSMYPFRDLCMSVWASRDYINFLFPTTLQECLPITIIPTLRCPTKSELATDCPSQEKECRENFPNIRGKVVAGNMFYLLIQNFCKYLS